MQQGLLHACSGGFHATIQLYRPAALLTPSSFLIVDPQSEEVGGGAPPVELSFLCTVVLSI
jgi:hypothetical protein